MNTKVKFFGMATLLFAVTACSSDELEMVNQGPEITFNTSVSRATETTTDNLEEFLVYGHGEGYDQMFINGLTATKKSEGYYKLSETKYWPSDVKTIEFWAVAGADAAGEIKINTSTQSINDFTPKAYNSGKAYDNSGSAHQDLILAYTKATNNPSISLTFHHALSQISINATSGNTTATTSETTTTTNDSHVVKIKGAWIVNALGKSSVSCTHDKDSNEPTDGMTWNAPTDETIYGYEFKTPIELEHVNKGLLSFGHDNSNLMIIPQNITKWELDKAKETTKGAYILLLCRVELKHEGTVHTGGSENDIYVEGNYHYHQLFPYSKTWENNEYGYTCVPLNNTQEGKTTTIKTEWEKGKRYTYNLNFCSNTSGAGIYPDFEQLKGKVPEGEKDGYKYILGTNGAPNKTTGDPVLTQPIDFNVTVEGWEDDETWKPIIP